jgi:2-oxoglutarate dehydrogenase E1 component
VWGSIGDVKYHWGTQSTKEYPNGKQLTVTLLANPSHLEAVDPVVLGRVRAEQHYMNDQERKKVCPILLHGDAAFAGQGTVYESMQMNGLFNYTTGGCIHIVVNNQIGFTTAPISSRSGLYCTDLGKSIDSPIIHVNADAVEDIIKACQLATEYRQEFSNDVIIDVIGFRRNGHNELDQPRFT